MYIDTRITMKIKQEVRLQFETLKNELGIRKNNDVLNYLFDLYNKSKIEQK